MTLRIMPTPVKPTVSEAVEVAPESVPTKPVVEPKVTKPKPVKKPLKKQEAKPEKVVEEKKVVAEVETQSVENTEVQAPPIAPTQEASQPILVEKPSFRVKPTPPHYPRVAKRRGQQGTVIVEVWLDKNGKQIQQLIAESSGFEALDEAAILAVTQWQFKGHIINGQSIESRLKVPVRFELN